MDTNTEQLNKQHKSLVAQARALTSQYSADNPMPKEVSDQIQGLLGKADEIKAHIELNERISGGEAFLAESAGPVAAHLGFRESAPGEGDAPVDVKAWRSFDMKYATPLGIETKELRFHVPLAVQAKGYGPAFEAYLRKGLHELGSRDRKALAEATDAAGGYLVPEDMQESIIKKIATLATVRQFARVISTSSNLVTWPRIRYTTDNEYTSGVRLTWTGETPSAATAHRVTDQVFGEFNIPVNTAMASQLISMNLIEDAAFDVIGVSSDLLGEAFALGENAAFWTGAGAGQPRGIITDASDTTNFDAAVQTAAGSNAIDADEVIDVIYALPAQYERNARVFMTKATEKYIRKLKDADSDYIWPVQALVGGFGVAVPELLGFPVTRDEFVNEISDATNTTTHPLVFGDLSGYVVVDRVGLSVKRDDSLYSELNQALLLARKRVGGQLTEAYRLSLLKTVNTT
jgi:HK97 family phage major capsid protein